MNESEITKNGIVDELFLEFDMDDPKLSFKMEKAIDSMGESDDNFHFHVCEGMEPGRFLTKTYIPYLKKFTPWRWLVNGNIQFPAQFFCPFCMKDLEE